MRFFQNCMIMMVNLLQIMIQDVINETANLSQKVTFEHSTVNIVLYFEKPRPPPVE